MFHYRNHGAGMSINCSSFTSPLTIYEDVGKILAAVQVPSSEDDAFAAFLKKLNYHYVEETNNPVYKQYLTAKAS